MNLPIENLTEKEFYDFRSKYLNSGRLPEESLIKIEKLFSSGDPSVGRIHCDENHMHGYKCTQYTNATTGVIDRLISEIRDYQRLVKDINKLTFGQ